MSFILVADIGGTNARFGLVDIAGTRVSPPNYQAQHQRKLRCADYPDIASMIRAYAEASDIALPDFACLAIAGPIHNGRVRMTNLAWEFSIEGLQRELGMEALDVLNDFAALAYATPHLGRETLAQVHPGNPDANAPLLVLGPGTGFGMAALVPCGQYWKIVPTEGGHCNFAPGNSREIAILEHLRKDHDHVSVEHLLCGQGLVRIYRAITAIEGKATQDYSPADINNKGQSGEDPMCRAALEQFCEMLGSTAGDKALDLGAQGGVFLGGGISPKIADFIPKTRLLERYLSKGPMGNYVRQIPLNVIAEDSAALVGTAAWLTDTTPALSAQAAQ